MSWRQGGLVVVLSGGLMVGAALAQVDVPRVESVAASAPAAASSILRGEQLPSASVSLAPQPVNEPMDAAARQAYQDALVAYYRYRQSGLEHRRNVFAWQYWSSMVIFGVVLVLVVCGIYFAALQFHRDLPSRQRGVADAGGAAGAAPSTVELSTGGLKVSSPVLGVVILVISLAFFYLYLAFVYPIREIF